jgi:hypothetical protein
MRQPRLIMVPMVLLCVGCDPPMEHSNIVSSMAICGTKIWCPFVLVYILNESRLLFEKLSVGAVVRFFFFLASTASLRLL